MKPTGLYFVLTGALLLAQPSQPGAATGIREVVELLRAGDCVRAAALVPALESSRPGDPAVARLGERVRGACANAKLKSGAVARPPQPAVRTTKPAVASAEARERAEAGSDLVAAERLIGEGDLPGALTKLEALEARGVELDVVARRKAETHSALGQFAAAAAIYARLAERHPEETGLSLRAAQNYAWDQNYGDAIPHYQRYLERVPSALDTRREFAGTLLWANRHSESVAEYRAYLKHRAADLEARHNLARALVWSGRFAEALPELLQVARQKPDDAEVKLALAQCYEQAGEWVPSLRAVEEVLARDARNTQALVMLRRLKQIAPMAEARAAIQARDYGAAARHLVAYLEVNTSDNSERREAQLTLARVHAWAGNWAKAEGAYDEYLELVPGDRQALAEAAQVEMSVPDFARARRYLLTLAAAGGASADAQRHLEQLVQAYAWDGQADAAEPHALRLVSLSPENTTARQVLASIASTRQSQALERARSLAAEKRYGEAILAYREYVSAHGSSQEIELAIARIYTWAEDYGQARQAYREFLVRHPGHADAELEWANTEKWAGNYEAAEQGYRTVLARDPDQAEALLGLAQIAEYRGADPFRVAASYQRVVEAEPANREARKSLLNLGTLISPSLAFHQSSFNDSDQFGRSQSSVEAILPFRGGLLAPFASYDYFSQLRQVGGASCGVSAAQATPSLLAISDRICAENGTSSGTGGGVRFELAPTRRLIGSGSVGAVSFGTNRTNLNVQAQLLWQPTRDKRATFGFTHRNAAYDVNTLAPLYAGVTGSHALASYEQPVAERWRVWFAAGLSRYSRGISAVGPLNTQRLFGARAEYRVQPGIYAGYYMRLTGFTQATPLYFSPRFYGTYGLSYSVRKPLSENVRFVADGQLGFGSIHRFNEPGFRVLEVVATPAIEWRIARALDLRLGYRLGRGRSSTFGSPTYSTGVFEFGIQHFFLKKDEPQASPLTLQTAENRTRD